MSADVGIEFTPDVVDVDSTKLGRVIITKAQESGITTPRIDRVTTQNPDGTLEVFVLTLLVTAGTTERTDQAIQDGIDRASWQKIPR